MEREHTKVMSRLAHAARLAHRRSGKHRPAYLAADAYEAIARGVYKELIMIDEERVNGTQPLSVLQLQLPLGTAADSAAEREVSEPDGRLPDVRVDICNLD